MDDRNLSSVIKDQDSDAEAALKRPLIARLHTPKDKEELARLVRYLLMDCGLNLWTSSVRADGDETYSLDVGYGDHEVPLTIG